MLLDFVKMQGAGNDYVYLTDFERRIKNKAELSRILSDRHFGIGSDGVVFVEKSSLADCKMVMFNADGSEGRMCGNAIRCVAAILVKKGVVCNNLAVVETKSGLKKIEIVSKNPFVAKVDMGHVSFVGRDLPTSYTGSCERIPFEYKNKKRTFSAVCTGNAHAVTVVNRVDSIDLKKIAKSINECGFFAEDVNVEICEIMSKTAVKVRVFERGSGETLACGTGAVAVAAALSRRGLMSENAIDVHLRGGVLRVERASCGSYFLTGGAAKTFWGQTEAEVEYVE